MRCFPDNSHKDAANVARWPSSFAARLPGRARLEGFTTVAARVTLRDLRRLRKGESTMDRVEMLE